MKNYYFNALESVIKSFGSPVSFINRFNGCVRVHMLAEQARAAALKQGDTEKQAERAALNVYAQNDTDKSECAAVVGWFAAFGSFAGGLDGRTKKKRLSMSHLLWAGRGNTRAVAYLKRTRAGKIAAFSGSAWFKQARTAVDSVLCAAAAVYDEQNEQAQAQAETFYHTERAALFALGRLILAHVPADSVRAFGSRRAAVDLSALCYLVPADGSPLAVLSSYADNYAAARVEWEQAQAAQEQEQKEQERAANKRHHAQAQAERKQARAARECYDNLYNSEFAGACLELLRTGDAAAVFANTAALEQAGALLAGGRVVRILTERAETGNKTLRPRYVAALDIAKQEQARRERAQEQNAKNA